MAGPSLKHPVPTSNLHIEVLSNLEDLGIGSFETPGRNVGTTYTCTLSVKVLLSYGGDPSSETPAKALTFCTLPSGGLDHEPTAIPELAEFSNAASDIRRFGSFRCLTSLVIDIAPSES
jgi:hypothetical protein